MLFAAGASYDAKLAQGSLGEGSAASFVFGGQVFDDPSQGVFVSIGGATVGLKLQSKKGYRSTARIMVLKPSESGLLDWIALPGSLALRSEKPFAFARVPKIEVRFHPAKGTWDLYVNASPLAEGLTLSGEEEGAFIRVSNQGSELAAVLENFNIDANPPAPPGRPVVTPEGTAANSSTK